MQALAKGDRDELAIQTCTELGVDRIIPWQASRSISRWKGDKLLLTSTPPSSWVQGVAGSVLVQVSLRKGTWR